MTDKEREELKKKLWKTADDLRQGAGLKASQYAQPVFGLIFLRFAENKYRKVEPQILAEYNAKKGKLNETPIEKIAMKKCGFYLPEKSRYEFILK